MKLRNILLILAAITLGFASCSSESDILSEIDTPVNGLDEETVAVSFNLGKDLQTKAGNGTQDASYDEATIHNCVIAIFDHATGTMLAKREFTPNDGLNRKGNAYITNNIETKAIPSDVIVVANCPVGFFNNVVTKEGFDKVVKESMEGLTESTLTASNLIKVWESTEEHPNGIDLKEKSNRNIQAHVRQIAARVDMELSLELMGDNKKDYDAYFETSRINVTNINAKAQLLNPLKDGEYYSDSFSWTPFNWEGFNWDTENVQNIENHTNIVIDNKPNHLVNSFYTYDNSDKVNHAVTLTIHGNLVVRNRITNKVENKSLTLRTITVNGSDDTNYIQRGYLYRILGTINYNVQEEKFTFDLEYQVEDWTEKTIDIPAFS